MGRTLKPHCLVIMLVTLTDVGSAQPSQTMQDEYAVYELLAPETGSFRTDYEVSVTTPGATWCFDRIGAGLQSAPAALSRGDRVIDVMTGAALEFQQVAGSEAKARGFAGADPEASYVAVRLARPVPPDGGQA